MLALDANFRSAPQVVEGINFLFERLMSPELGDTAYGDGQRLVCGAPGTYAGRVEAHFLPDDTAETDANFIAEKIEQLVAAGEPVREGSATRPVRYEDCCILLAARGRFPGLCRGTDGPGPSRFMPTPGKICWTPPTSGLSSPCCGSSTTPRRTSIWRCHAGAAVRLHGR